ncbi:GH1 family beta-glucosidase [Bradyrhizobium sp. BWA-3-5]|uniref:GH1 family beta-glucosidase n=1 Tax=Bradyrhizobium sp. BWA-3-5 TaxID=3080013 RepID=UPI00293E0599|nr:GH1 family beta-glucosidase [Bradyrhizobium sp. BWA-3-5]WOH68754.1 GH1 family beta-glucosidase [Bradyrhizobium sp. BWA-3-5]
MSFKRFSRRQFGRIAGWSALGMSMLPAAPGLTQSDARSGARNMPASSGFPNGFLWGTATSAYQIEGAVNEDGRGPSIWDRFSHTPGAIADGSNGDTATDHYRLYKEDIHLMKELGTKAYRFSIAWPRVFPDGTGSPNPKGLDFYKRLIDELSANGIEPFATLYHWDLPQAMQERVGGWTSLETPNAFADYAGYVARQLGDRVKYFFTINECSRLVHLGHGLGGDAPGLKLPPSGLNQVRHHVALAHGLAVQAIRAQGRSGTKVGPAENVVSCIPAIETPANIGAAEKATRELNAGYMTVMMEGKYTDAYLEKAGRDAPKFTPEDLRVISSPIDFVGLNVYTPDHYVIAADNSRGFTLAPFPASFPHMKADWLRPGPEAIYWVPRHVAKLWNVKSIYITENGTSGSDKPAADGTIYDVDRIMYLRNYLTQLQRATSEGLPVTGYFLWSLMDNFEWSDGYEQRFGIYHVDFETKRRTPKLSASFYRETIARNAVV